MKRKFNFELPIYGVKEKETDNNHIENFINFLNDNDIEIVSTQRGTGIYTTCINIYDEDYNLITNFLKKESYKRYPFIYDLPYNEAYETTKKMLLSKNLSGCEKMLLIYDFTGKYQGVNKKELKQYIKQSETMKENNKIYKYKNHVISWDYYNQAWTYDNSNLYFTSTAKCKNYIKENY